VLGVVARASIAIAWFQKFVPRAWLARGSPEGNIGNFFKILKGPKGETRSGLLKAVSWKLFKIRIGWWYTYPSEKYESMGRMTSHRL